MSWNQPGSTGADPPDHFEPWDPEVQQAWDGAASDAPAAPDYSRDRASVPPPDNARPPVDPYGRQPLDAYGRPLVDAYGRPPVHPYGRPPVDPYGRPLVDAYDRPLVDPSDWQPGYGPPEVEVSEQPRHPTRVVTPSRMVVFVALVASGAVAAYSLLIARGSQSIAITVSALAIFGLMSALAGLIFAGAGVRSARDGRIGRAFAGGLVGGLFMLLAAGAVATAIIFALLTRA